MKTDKELAVQKTLVIGVGNTVMGDDGLGIYALNELVKRPLPDNVDTLEAGTALLDAMPDLEEYDKIVFIDAIDSEDDDVMVIRDPASSASMGRTLSQHDLGIQEVLNLILLEKGSLPETVIIGIRPEQITFSMRLSEGVSAKMPTLLDAIYIELRLQPLTVN